MKRGWKIAIWLAGGLVLSAGAQADIVASAGNPYGPIMTRNIFGLNPVQATETATDPPPKITLNGIMSIFGKAQALYKVAGTGKPGQAAKDQSYILSEGQRQDDIEVTHIDDHANLVTFNNHGTVQEVPLASAPVVTGPGPVGPAGLGGQVVPRPHLGRPAGVPGGGNGGNGNGINRLGGGGQNRGGNGANQGGPYAAAMGGGSTMQSSGGGGYSNPPQQPQDNMTPEERAAALLITTEKLKSEGYPTWQIMPPMPGGSPTGM